MTVEAIQAIGRYIVLPNCAAIGVVAFMWAMK